MTLQARLCGTLNRFTSSRSVQLKGLVISVAAAWGLMGCATSDGSRPEMPRLASAEVVWVVTADQQLVSFQTERPRRIRSQQALSGLKPVEQVVGIDFRVARGTLYALTDAGRLMWVDTRTGALTPVADTPLSATFRGQAFGFDFNPTVDRIRVVNESGQNLRLHPDTGALVSTDPDLAYAPGDVHAGRPPQVVAAAYTYNPQDDKLTTNFAIDRATGALVTQGTREGVEPVVSPNTGQLFTVGPLGIAAFDDIAFDISDVNNVALVVAAASGARRAVLYRVNLDTGVAQRIGPLGVHGQIRGMAIEP